MDYAPDRGVNGSANYPIEFDLTSDFKETQVIVFPCVATTIYELVNQGALKRVNDITVYDGASDSEPRQYGIERGQGLLTLFSPPDTTTRLKIVAGDGPAIRFLLINSTPDHPTGVGYAVGVPSARLANYNKPPDPKQPGRHRPLRGHQQHVPARRQGHVEPGRLPHQQPGEVPHRPARRQD